LNLSKEQAELFGSGLKGWNPLHRDTEWCFSRNHHNEFKEFFSQEYDLVFCNGVCSVIQALGYYTIQLRTFVYRLFKGWLKSCACT
jgi:hypothetical protein